MRTNTINTNTDATSNEPADKAADAHTHQKKEKPRLVIKANVKAGGGWFNHNETMIRTRRA